MSDIETRFSAIIALHDVDGESVHLVNLMGTIRFTRKRDETHTRVYTQDSHLLNVQETLGEILQHFERNYTGLGLLGAFKQDEPDTAKVIANTDAELFAGFKPTAVALTSGAYPRTNVKWAQPAAAGANKK